MWQGKPAETKLKGIYGNSLKMSHNNCASLSEKSKSKNWKETRINVVDVVLC